MLFFGIFVPRLIILIFGAFPVTLTSVVKRHEDRYESPVSLLILFIYLFIYFRLVTMKYFFRVHFENLVMYTLEMARSGLSLCSLPSYKIENKSKS